MAAKHAERFFADPAKAYLAETRNMLPCSTADPATLARLSDDAVAADLVLFVKAGCGHCARAEALTETFASRHVVSLDTAPQRAALAEKLRLPALTTPIVFVRGRCVGGGEELKRLVGAGGLENLHAAFPTDPFAPGVPDVSSWTERRVCKPPGGAAPINYFLNCYGNTVRGTSCVHAAVFGALTLLAPEQEVFRAVAGVLCVDVALFTLSSNISPVALSCTSLLWTRRGPVVPAIPYKVVFVTYILWLLSAVSGNMSTGQLRAAAAGSALNSAFLGVLRF